MDTTLFTPITVIGTILAMIFAAGALWNSLARRKQLMSEKREAAEERFSFKPPSQPRTVTPSDKSPDKPSAASPTPTSHTPLFRQIRPSGAVENDPVATRVEDELYVWE